MFSPLSIQGALPPQKKKNKKKSNGFRKQFCYELGEKHQKREFARNKNLEKSAVST